MKLRSKLISSFVPYATKPISPLKISKPKSKTPSTNIWMLLITPSMEEKEPIVDVLKEDYVKIMVELLALKKKDINLNVKNDILTISTETPARKYYKEVKLPTFVQKDSLEFKYRNGILEAKLRKAKGN